MQCTPLLYGVARESELALERYAGSFSRWQKRVSDVYLIAPPDVDASCGLTPPRVGAAPVAEVTPRWRRRCQAILHTYVRASDIAKQSNPRWRDQGDF